MFGGTFAAAATTVPALGGGVAPTGACDAATQPSTAVAYRSTYVFCTDGN